MAKKNKIKVTNLDTTLRNFLYYMLDNIDTFTGRLIDAYIIEDKRQFIYNCSIISIYEFIQNESYFLAPEVAGERLQEIFHQNMYLEQFDEPKNKVKVPSKTEKIIDFFKALKNDLNDIEKNKIATSVNNLLASTI